MSDPTPPTDVAAELMAVSIALQWEEYMDDFRGIPLDAFTDIRTRKVAAWLAVNQSEAMLNAISDPQIGPEVVTYAHTSTAFAAAKKTVMECLRFRQLITIGQQLMWNAQNGKDTSLEAEAALSAVHTRKTGARHISEIMPEAIEYLQALARRDISAVGYPTNIICVDRLILGLRPAELIILAARPGIGKSALAAQWSASIAKSGAPVALYSFEMKDTMILVRLLCAFAGVSNTAIARGTAPADSLANIGKAADQLKSRNLYMEELSGGTIADVRSSAKAVRAKAGALAGIVVDYLQVVQPAGKTETREQAVSSISSDLKRVAMELECFTLGLCQLNRSAENTKPRLDQLRESGAIEQDADIVGLLHRDRAEGSDAVLNIAKNRNGETGDAHLRFLPAFCRFEDAKKVDDF